MRRLSTIEWVRRQVASNTRRYERMQVGPDGRLLKPDLPKLAAVGGKLSAFRQVLDYAEKHRQND